MIFTSGNGVFIKRFFGEMKPSTFTSEIRPWKFQSRSRLLVLYRVALSNCSIVRLEGCGYLACRAP